MAEEKETQGKDWDERHRRLLARLQEKDFGFDLRGWRGTWDGFMGHSRRHRQVIDERIEIINKHPARSVFNSREMDVAHSELGTFLDDSRWASVAVKPEDLGRAYEPDFLFLREDADGQWILRSGVICFPSAWAPEDAMGEALFDIHESVPGLNDSIGVPLGKFLHRLERGRVWQRMNWGLAGGLARDLHPRRTRARPVDMVEVWGDLVLRIEEQLLFKLPICGDLVFALKIWQSTLAEVSELRGGAIAALRHQILTMPEAMLAYKGLVNTRKLLELAT